MHASCLVLAVSLIAPPSAPPPSAAPPTAAPTAEAPSPAPPTAGPPTAAPPTAAPPSATPPSEEPAPLPELTAADNGWDDTPTPEPLPEAKPEPVPVAAGGVVVGTWQPPPPPDPALVERNRQLSAQKQQGERWLIGGRVGAPLSLIPIAAGAALLGAHAYRKRNDGRSAEPSHTPPPNPSMALAGGGLVALGIIGLGTSITFAVLGFMRMQDATAGRLSLSAGRRHAGLSYTRRF